MIIRLSNEAAEEFRCLYVKYPDMSNREHQLLDDLLYALSRGEDLTIGVAGGSLHMIPTWRKK